MPTEPDATPQWALPMAVAAAQAAVIAVLLGVLFTARYVSGIAQGTTLALLWICAVIAPFLVLAAVVFDPIG